MLNLFKTRTQICLCFPKKAREKKFPPVQNTQFCQICNNGRWELWYTTTTQIGKFQYWTFPILSLCTLLCLSLNPHRKRCICQDHVISPTFPSLPECHHTFIIACNSHPKEVIRNWQILSQEPPTEKKLGEIRTITWWLFLSLAKFFLKSDRYLFISNFSRGLSGY